MMPIGVGGLYLLPLLIVPKYFTESKGAITGLVLGAFGFSGIFIQNVMLFVINPENVKPMKIDG